MNHRIFEVAFGAEAGHRLSYLKILCFVHALGAEAGRDATADAAGQKATSKHRNGEIRSCE